MHRLFLDANVLFSAAYRADSGLGRLWQLRDVALHSSRYALEKARINLDQEDQRARLDRLSEKLLFSEAGAPTPPHGVSLPEKDVSILVAALAAGCTHLLTGDIRHFGPYLGKKIQGMQVMLTGDYLRASRDPE